LLELKERLLVAPSEENCAQSRVIGGEAELLLAWSARQQSC
jgi:hypothetical protein